MLVELDIRAGTSAAGVAPGPASRVARQFLASVRVCRSANARVTATSPFTQASSGGGWIHVRELGPARLATR